MLSSIMDYKDRGKWGNSSYRGNVSGFVIRDLLLHFKPLRFLECFAGGGTGYEVAQELQFRNSIHLDLNPRFGSHNLLTDEMPSGSDFVFSHPPYFDIIKYSGKGNMWGEEAHKDDLSHIADYDDFIKKIDKINAKVYQSLVNGGVHCFLIGDVRKKGKYYSIIKDMAYIGDLKNHLIKAQNNTFSERKQYKGDFIPITHEHLLIFKKNQLWHTNLQLTKTIAYDLKNVETMTWRDLVQAALQEIGSKATLQQIYNVVSTTKKAEANQHWQAKVRQTLQINPDFVNLSRGVWSLTIFHNSRMAS